MDDEPGPGEAHLAHRRQEDAGGDDEDVYKSRQPRPRQGGRPGDQEGRHGRDGLEHLDEGHRQGEVHEVGAHERYGIEEPDREDVPEVQTPRDWDIGPGDEGGIPRQQLGEESRRGEMDGCQGDGCDDTQVSWSSNISGTGQKSEGVGVSLDGGNWNLR